MMEKCIVCLKMTDKCCGLCRKVFYCSAEHQEVHWGMSHKYVCEGRYQSPQFDHDDFKIYEQEQLARSSLQHDKHIQQQNCNTFLQLFSQRLDLRKHLLIKYISLRESNVVPTIHKQLVKEAQQLYQLSKRIAESYQSSLSEILEQRGLITNNFIIKIDELLDKVFLAKCYQACSMQKELKQILLNINNEAQAYPQHLTEQFASCYKNLLSSIIDVSELANLDKISQKMFSLYIKLIERFQGIWEQVYAYFNMGMWYSAKTYNQKALKCFLYSLDLVQSHKTSRQVTESASIFKGDAMYNIAICRYLLNERQKAVQSMQEAYKLRSHGLGKSSIEASCCLLTLSKWHLQQKRYDSCLQFVMQCYRIRKSNASFSKQLLEVNSFIVRMYEVIRKDKQQSVNTSNTQQTQYFNKLLEDQQAFRQIELENKQSFTKRLLDNEKQMVVFKLIISPELADTLSSMQWSKASNLIDLIDTEMEKEEAIRIIFESEFTQCLEQDQRNTFIKLNKLI